MRTGVHHASGAESPMNGAAQAGAVSAVGGARLLISSTRAASAAGIQDARPRSAAPRSAMTTRSRRKGTCMSAKSCQSSWYHAESVGSTTFGSSGCVPVYARIRGGGCAFGSSPGPGGTLGEEKVGMYG